ncbi:hypothetical protein GGI25_000059 [Coemansia spiralis]|uniref:RRM domain-containing protein n=2 Tax=Coemansia TaxID=4863 RepID=A0A9W8GFJ0_9FUNG|nr:hypothetical protein BX070DRAFT_218820 [Coemansia spiralis]KAJ1992558.1 hypothetical protein EDC05_002704 [Coemansia umbellata]KAJ2623062.1 hypothetical protein GGI26_002671 [Coemansia sp. RSA 1358]KAJ2681104.1 hypothetical protein GGI25_000059 [Coemansia spiralis]
MSASPETKPAEKYPFKAFVGNLSFKTTDGELKEFFADVGDVKEARIVTRGPRSLGFGFVAFGSEAALDRAVAAKHQTEMQGRVINVEAARPESERPSHAPKEPKEPKAPKGQSKAQPKTQPKARVDSEEKQSQEKPQQSRARGPRRFPRKNKEAEPAGEQQQRLRELRQPSDTVAFVGNLPFATTDEELSKLFADFSIASAHVVANKRSNRPKGYGFVTFSTPEDHAAAVARYSAEPLKVNDRVLAIKAALSEGPASDSAPETE